MKSRDLGRGAERGAAALFRDGPRFRGRVIPGRRLGRRFGVPTANLAAATLDPACFGSWAAVAWLDGRPYRALAHAGIRPSVGGGAPVIEVHLLDFAGDLYGAPLTVRLLAKVADEIRAPTRDDLARKIHADLALVRAFFARRPQFTVSTSTPGGAGEASSGRLDSSPATATSRKGTR